MKLIETILNKMPKVSKFQKKFFIVVAQMFLAIQGKINFRSLSRYSGLSEKTFRRWFQKHFDFALFNTLAIEELEKFEEVGCAIDACFLEKAGKVTYGIAHFWNGCRSKAEKGLETTLAAIINIKTKTAYPLYTEQTPPAEEINLAGSNGESTRIDFYISVIKKIGESIKKFTKVLICDGYYTKKKFIDGVSALGFTYVGKLRSDANLKILYNGEHKKVPGRPKKFEKKCDVKKLDGFTFLKDIDEETRLYEGTFYSVCLERKIKVVAVTSTAEEQVPVALLFSTDIEMNGEAIYLYYTARFQIEFVLRDAQQFTGFGSCQSRKKESLHFHTNISLVAINIVKVQEQLEFDQTKKKIFSMLNHKIKNHNETLISRFFSLLDIDLTSIKSKPVYNDMVNYGVIFHESV
jgi:hypothetical protein